MSSALTTFSTMGAYTALFALLLVAAVSDIQKRTVSNRIVISIVIAWIMWRVAVICDAFEALHASIASGALGGSAGIISDAASGSMSDAMLGTISDVTSGAMQPLVYLRPVSAITDTLISLAVAIAFAFILFAAVTVYERIRGKYAFGGADIKLIAAIALFVPVETVCAIVFIACVISLMYALAGLYSRNRRGIPFAPCLACALPLALLVL